MYAAVRVNTVYTSPHPFIHPFIHHYPFIHSCKRCIQPSSSSSVGNHPFRYGRLSTTNTLPLGEKEEEGGGEDVMVDDTLQCSSITTALVSSSCHDAPTYPTYLPTLPTYHRLPTYPTYLPTHLPTYHHLSTHLSTHPPTYLPSPTYSPIYPPTYLSTLPI